MPRRPHRPRLQPRPAARGYGLTEPERRCTLACMNLARASLFAFSLTPLLLSSSCGGEGEGGGGTGGQAGHGGSTTSSATGGTGGTGSSGGSGTGGSGTGGSNTGGKGGGSTGTPCDPSCTGARMCDDGGDCVCAPGWVFDGADCVAETITDPLSRTKAEVCARYAEAVKAPALDWVAGGGGCDPGTVPFEAQVATLRYLDFYRWMVGVGPVQVNPAVAAAEQQCALMLNDYFGHDPGPDVMCYTPEGAAACGASLIAQGYGLMGQVDGYALETGQNFIHHRNVLAVGRAGVWFGKNGASSDMHYGGAYPALPTDPKLVAHPGPGLQVMNKVPLNWWFVQKGTQSTPPLAARVFVKSTMEPKPMVQQHHYTDFSSFQTSGWTPQADVAYLVELVDDAQAVVSSFETTFIACP